MYFFETRYAFFIFMMYLRRYIFCTKYIFYFFLFQVSRDINIQMAQPVNVTSELFTSVTVTSVTKILIIFNLLNWIRIDLCFYYEAIVNIFYSHAKTHKQPSTASNKTIYLQRMT